MASSWWNRWAFFAGAEEVFPSLGQVSASGLLKVGGLLTPETILQAYARGIFPWPTAEGLLTWWSPDPRAILDLAEFHVPRRLERTIRQRRFEITRNRDFRGVIQGCASAAGRADNTWITPQIVAAYVQLHELGFAHSVEAWREGRLVGGVYGLALGGLFAAESMFFVERDASKAALAHLARHVASRGFVLFDVQQMSPHLARLGACNIARAEYQRRLAAALSVLARFDDAR